MASDTAEVFAGSFTQQEPIPEEAIDAAVAVMRHGRVLQVASGSQLRAHPEDPYVERLLELGGNRA